MVTKPEQCALAIAIPLNRDDFLAELDRGTDKDFVRNLLADPTKVTKEVFWNHYAPTAKVVNWVADEVQKSNVTVEKNATLNKLRELFQKFRVVTLVAHWRSSRFYASDFINPNQLIRALEQPSTPLAQKLVSALPENWVQNIQALKYKDGDKHTLPKLLSEDFNNIVKSSKLYSDPVSSQVSQVAPYDDEYCKYLNRSAIDDAFRGVISPGNRIEFSDQLHPIEEVVKAIPENYDGLLDFTVCNSVLIGNVIKRQRHCVVLVNKEPATPEIRMVIYKGIIELLAEREIDYMEAAAMIHHSSLRN